jgi:phosphoglycolate phosphatase-like HAD superfamily hydrolase
MKLIVFDLDGTLALTNRVDGECYTRALEETLRISDLDTNWTRYDHVTDHGIAFQVFAERCGRSPTSEESLRLVDHFMNLLRQECDLNVQECMEVPGACKTLTQLKAGNQWGVALATGAWQRSAEFKIERAGLPLGDVPKAYSEDGPSRESIVMTAISRAAAHYGRSSFDRIVSVGDAGWDVRTAAKLNLPFLGIARGERAHRLRGFGARDVIENFNDTVAFLSRLEAAVVPEDA